MLLSNSAFQKIFSSYYAVHVCDAVALFISHSFFGEDPPLLAIFLKKLGYEVTKNTCFIFVSLVLLTLRRHKKLSLIQGNIYFF